MIPEYVKQKIDKFDADIVFVCRVCGGPCDSWFLVDENDDKYFQYDFNLMQKAMSFVKINENTYIQSTIKSENTFLSKQYKIFNLKYRLNLLMKK